MDEHNSGKVTEAPREMPRNVSNEDDSLLNALHEPVLGAQHTRLHEAHGVDDMDVDQTDADRNADASSSVQSLSSQVAESAGDSHMNNNEGSNTAEDESGGPSLPSTRIKRGRASKKDMTADSRPPLVRFASSSTMSEASTSPEPKRRRVVEAPPEPTENIATPMVIKGLFPLLELYSEVGSGGPGSGLVDKIVISQDSLQDFVNTVHPGAYKSVTQIDFKGLDNVTIKPIGIYGSKSEIVRFLCQVDAIDDAIAALLLTEDDPSWSLNVTGLRSGIYVLMPPSTAKSDAPATTYVIYWPQDGTWDDSAVGSARTNRVTFMRHLTRLTDQIRGLISPHHASALVWKDADKAPGPDDMDDFGFELSDAATNAMDEEGADGRFFGFEVTKTSDQDEGAEIGSGFTVRSREIMEPTAVSFTRLVSGESGQAFLNRRFVPGTLGTESLAKRKFTVVALRDSLKGFPRIILDTAMTPEMLFTLLKVGGLDTRANVKGIWNEYQRLQDQFETQHGKAEKESTKIAVKKAVANALRLRPSTNAFIARHVGNQYPCLDVGAILAKLQGDDDEIEEETDDYLKELWDRRADVRTACKKILKSKDFSVIDGPLYKKIKCRYFDAQKIINSRKADLTEEQRNQILEAVVKGKRLPHAEAPQVQSLFGRAMQSVKLSVGTLVGLNGAPDASQSDGLEVDSSTADGDFLDLLVAVVSREPAYNTVAERIHKLALESLARNAARVADAIIDHIAKLLEKEAIDLATDETVSRTEKAKDEAFTRFRKKVSDALTSGPLERRTLRIHSISADPNRKGSYVLEAVYDKPVPAHFDHSLWRLQLVDDDVRRVQEDPQFVPRPLVSQGPTVTFDLPSAYAIQHVQVIGSKASLVVASAPDGTFIWLCSAHQSGLPKVPTKKLPILASKRSIVAVNEQKRLVALIVTDESTCYVQLFMMDEAYSTLGARGAPFQLATWYPDVGSRMPDIVKACFFSGTDDLCLVESSGRMRVFSFLSQSFRPATVELGLCPAWVDSSPDGSVILVVNETTASRRELRVYHHASFGQRHEGISYSLPREFDKATSFSVTSLGQLDKVFLMALTPATQSIVSVAVSISKKETEYQFRAKADTVSPNTAVPTVHNSLVDCFAEVWERYPVVAAIQRETISPDSRLPASITFVCDRHDGPFKSYFKQLIQNFERVSRKPTEQRLDRIQVIAAGFDELDWNSSPLNSLFKLGEWLVELLCLIPIHIAVACENQFVPLKDGVFDRALEQQLLGAEVSTIIDAISLGWYESIFKYYNTSKVVKVVSSMGEQSVGKSYSLNHLIDSSFAGSAVRTTEGVWLSVCPTRDTLVVALDFEGVHSIERTAQEDMLLVLFNTALSNLVLFRNNFALSRDVANMFTSFQASTHLFDPAANPRLFKGLLAIVIKDVVDGDKKEIVKEFSSKFSQIVTKEHESNFITMLHHGQLNIIPWSVIQSRDFYLLFAKLGKLLGRQEATHGSAGEFLTTIKTLMAKMKAQDWGSVDQTLIKHRTSTLATILPFAFAFGTADDMDLGTELCNVDDQIAVPHSDTPSKFYIDKDPVRALEALASHLAAWKPDAARYPSDDLRLHLNQLVERRIQHVQDWLTVNISRFPGDNADIRQLKRLFDDIETRLRANVQLCSVECSDCRLRCTMNKAHDQLSHDCGTSHRCADACDFSTEHDSLEPCGLPAGHGDNHICDGAAHLCRTQCDLHGKRGCEVRCTRPVDHPENSHMCSARMHQCGEPCGVSDMQLDEHKTFSCENLCSLPYDDVHDMHSCENRQSCPIECQLCSRYCTMGDHFHGLEAGAVHLCGQEHACSHQCEAEGICEINTAPQSVPHRFVGQRDTFQYTKYTQVARRQACAIPILPGCLTHTGSHSHSTEDVVFHFCTAACVNCGYICSLPLGHRQVEHETAHGSMQNTHWAIEGAEDATIDLEGHTFAALDGGAPQLCSSVCTSLGRHAHIDYCRNADRPNACIEPESEHITTPMAPNPERPKDWVSHKVFWARTGFRDPYSRRDQQDFAKCDARCGGPEHQDGDASLCTLPMFHPPHPTDWAEGHDESHVSTDGHLFPCPDPNSMRQAYHIIFALDMSGSMTLSDRRPLANQPVTQIIVQSHDNRFGAVLSALYGLWVSMDSRAGQRRDSYSVVALNHGAQVVLENDMNSTPEALIHHLARIQPHGGTNFDEGLRYARHVMETHWAEDRSPVIVFLSDGESQVTDGVISGICDRAVALGKALSFHSISFGDVQYSASLTRMKDIASNVLQAAPRDAASDVLPCTFSDAQNTVHLAETFLTIAESLKKPRASLIRL